MSNPQLRMLRSFDYAGNITIKINGVTARTLATLKTQGYVKQMGFRPKITPEGYQALAAALVKRGEYVPKKPDASLWGFT